MEMTFLMCPLRGLLNNRLLENCVITTEFITEFICVSVIRNLEW